MSALFPLPEVPQYLKERLENHWTTKVTPMAYASMIMGLLVFAGAGFTSLAIGNPDHIIFPAIEGAALVLFSLGCSIHMVREMYKSNYTPREITTEKECYLQITSDEGTEYRACYNEKEGIYDPYTVKKP